MSETSAIEWTGGTWNPWSGCTHVSEGCDNCYMFTLKKRWGQNPEEVVRSKTTFFSPKKWGEQFVFSCSMSDFFHRDADAWRDEAWEVIRSTPHLTYQILTKRPGRIERHLPADWGDGYPNVWMGTSVELQKYVNRIAVLVSIPARLRFISAEPLLGPLDIEPWLFPFLPSLDWVIVGGESGHKARPMELDWARSLRDQCAANGVAFFLKQLGGRGDKRGGEKAVLDGRRHTEMPRLAKQPAPAPKASGLRYEVLSVIADAGEAGCTRKEIEAATGMLTQTVTPRLVELEQSGDIEKWTYFDSETREIKVMKREQCAVYRVKRRIA